MIVGASPLQNGGGGNVPRAYHWFRGELQSVQSGTPEKIPLAVRHVRSFLLSNRPA